MIDLHTHTTASDGRTPPEQLLAEAARAGVTVLGLADHDTTAAWDTVASTVTQTGVSLVRGMEISAKADSVPVHLLGFLFDPASPELVAHCERLRRERESRAREMVARIARDVPLQWHDVVAQLFAGGSDPVSTSVREADATATEREASTSSVIGRPHIADALIANGVAKNRQEAFERFLLPGSPYYVPHYAPQALDVVEWVNRAGGKLVFAHPDAPQRGKTPSHNYLRAMAEAGMFGIEIDHRDNRDREALARLAGECGLVRTGASDYHGSGKPNRLGENTTSREALEQLVDKAFLEVLEP